MNLHSQLKPLYWIASAKRDFLALPEKVREAFAHALTLAQKGEKAIHAKPLSGFGGAGVVEVVESYKGNAYRAVYTVRIGATVYVLHCFQKKSTHGIATPKPDIDLIRERLKAAERLAKEDSK